MKVGTLAQNLLTRQNISTTLTQLSKAEQQVSSGEKTPVFSGLGTDAATLLGLKSARDNLETYSRSISTVQRRASVMQTSLNQINDVAADMRAEVIKVSPDYKTDASVRSILRVRAAEAIEEVNRVLNVQFEGRYLFSGIAVGTQPMADKGAVGTAGTPMDSVNGLITGYTNGTAAAVIANVDTYFSAAGNFYTGNEGYNGDQSATQISARVDETYTITYGVRGDDRAVAQILNALYTLSTLDYDAANEAGFDTIFDNALTNLTDGLDALSRVYGELGVKEQQLQELTDEHESAINTLTLAISEIEDADQYEAITEFQRLQSQLQASYQVTATLRSLTLTNYL